MSKQQITSAKIRQPSGHFSHATMVAARGRIVFISGMTARRPDGTIAGIGDVEGRLHAAARSLSPQSLDVENTALVYGAEG